MTISEVVVSLGISALALGAIFNGYHFSVITAEKAALSLAANAKAIERLEETRSARWDTTANQVVDYLVATNFPVEIVGLGLTPSNSAVIMATNTTTISQISTNPPLRRIHVDCVWRFRNGRLYTNSVETCRAPDQ